MKELFGLLKEEFKKMPWYVKIASGIVTLALGLVAAMILVVMWHAPILGIVVIIFVSVLIVVKYLNDHC